MPTCVLNAKMVEKLKPINGERAEYPDRKVTGLVLRVAASGAKTWAVRYRHRGRSMRLTLGSVDVITLAKARERARNELLRASGGADPATEKQDGKKAETIGELAELYIEKWAKVRKRSWKADDNLLRRKILPRWQHRAIVDITRQDVFALVEKVADAGAPIVANRVAALCSKMFNYAVDRNLLTTSPAVRIARPGREQQRDRVFTEDEVRTLWTAFEKLDAPMAAFYKLRLLTAQRGGEVSSMRWVDLDLKGAWWTIPASVAKNGLPHRVPLSPSVVAIIEALKSADGDDSEFVLGAVAREKGSGARGKRQQADAAKTFKVPDFRGHDLRRTAASLMTGGGVSRLTVGKILNHREPGVTAVYDRHSYDPEKRAALDWWALKLAAIVDDTRAKVLAFARQA